APSYARPQGVPGDLELTEQVAQHGQAHPDDCVVVALDGADVGPTEPVDGERPRHPQGLAGRDVRLDLLVTQVGEVHERGGRGPDGAAGPASFDVPEVDEPVAGVEYAGAPAHLLPPADCLGRVGGLAVHLAVKLQDGVATEHEVAVRAGGGHLLALGAGQQQREVGGFEWAACGRLGGG